MMKVAITADYAWLLSLIGAKSDQVRTAN